MGFRQGVGRSSKSSFITGMLGLALESFFVKDLLVLVVSAFWCLFQALEISIWVLAGKEVGI